MATDTDTRAVVIDYLVALTAAELVGVLTDVLAGSDDTDQDSTAAERRAARRIFTQGRA